MIRIRDHCRRLLLTWVYRGHCICRVASATSEGCHRTSRQLEIQTYWPQKCSVQVGGREGGTCSIRHMECGHSMVGLDHPYPRDGIQSSVTKFRFENNQPVEVCDEWYYVVHYLKSMVSNVEESLNDLGLSSLTEADGLNWYARPYHYTTDDIVDIRRLHSPDESVYSRSTVYDAALSETDADMSQKHCTEANIPVDDSTNRFHAPHILNVGSSFDKFLTSTVSAICDLVQFRCDCSISRDLLRHGGPAELLPYLDAKTFYSGLLTGLDQSHNSYVLHCDNVSRQLVLDSSGLLRVENSQDPHLLSSGTSSSLTPGGNSDKQKLPNVDQLRAVQDNLAYNMPKLFTSGHEYRIYTEDIVFENRWFPGCTYTTNGQMMYSLEIARLRFFIHIRLANVRIQLLKTTAHPDDGTVRVRWRVVGIPVTHAVKFWNFLPWTKRRTGSDNTQWMDGFSTFYVGENGLVYKHKMDRIIPDDGIEVTSKKGVIEKLVGITSPAATT